MNLTRCQDQKRQTLTEFYVELAEHENQAWLRESAKAMLSLIERLGELPGKSPVYGLTSHERLCLLAADTYQSPWFVIISALDKRNYFIEYLMPRGMAPWPGAYVRGEASSEEDAVRMISIAMERSEGWIR